MSRTRFLRLAAASALRPSRPPSEFTSEELAEAELGKGLPPGFILGAATAAHQVEGGNENDWTDWERTRFPDGRPHILDGSVCGAASDSWNRFDEDLRLLQELGANGYRFGVEWARLEPEEGAWNAEAAARYRGWLTKLKDAGIRSMVTAHHFTLPRWVAKDGGFADDRILPRFDRYVTRLADAFGDLVDLWCTINEPNVLALQGYLKGIWPPGQHSQAATAAVMARGLKAHARAARILRDRTHKPVGIAHHVRVFQPARRSALDRVMAALSDDFVNQVIIDAYRTGRIQIYIPGQVHIDEAVEDLEGSFDYLGLNYYSRDHVQTDLKDPALSRQFVPEGRPVTDLHWDVYPEGMYLLLKRWGSLGLPIHVTENGVADNKGDKRGDFLRAHFYALQRAVQDGVDVRGYFHWSLIDNFEWAEGFTARFGLYQVDYQSPDKRRSPTSGVPVFQQIAKNLGLLPRDAAGQRAAGAR